MKKTLFGSAFNKNNQSSESGFQVDLDYTQNLKEEKPKQTATQSIFEWLEIIVTSVIAVIVVFGLLFRVATIDGPSMQNTLYNGEKIIITNFAYKAKQGDIVVVSRNTQNSVENDNATNGPIIKRVIAVGGQTVDIDFKTGKVSVDGKVLKEDYISTPTYDKYEVNFPVKVPEGCVFVLGDNRGNSLDSRSASIGDNGMIDEKYILGHAVFRVFPFERMGRLDNK